MVMIEVKSMVLVDGDNDDVLVSWYFSSVGVWVVLPSRSIKPLEEMAMEARGQRRW